MANPLDAENFWTQKTLYNEAEKNYVMHISKLLSGCLEKDKKRAPVLKGSISQTIATAPALTVTKKEKEKKNKQVNKIVNVESNVKGAPVQRVPASPRKLPVEREVENKDVVNTVNAHPNKKSKKDRRWYHANKINNSEDEELNNKNTKTSVNGSAKGIEHAQDEKKAGSGANQGTLVSEIAKARQHIKNSLERMDGIAALAAASPGGDVLQRISALETENKNLVELTNLLQKTLSQTQDRVQALETRLNTLSISGGTAATTAAAPANGTAAKKPEAAEDDDDVDLFGSESEGEDEAAAKVREQRLAEYAAKKSKKPALIAKSSLVLDIKPWSDETDLKAMEEEVRKIASEGLLWGASKLVPVAFGIKKLTISCVVEDEKVSIDWLTEQIEAIEEHVQSVDVAAFNKI